MNCEGSKKKIGPDGELARLEEIGLLARAWVEIQDVRRER
jgi:hypothetical protein